MDSEMPTTRRQQISNETLRRMSGTKREWRYAGPISALCIAAGIVVLAAVGIGL